LKRALSSSCGSASSALPASCTRSSCCLIPREALHTAQPSRWPAQWPSPASPPRSQAPETKGCRLGTTLALFTSLPPASAPTPRSDQRCADHAASLQSALRPHHGPRVSCRSGVTQTSLTAQRCSTRYASSALRQHHELRWWASAVWGEFSRGNVWLALTANAHTGSRSWPSSTATAPPSARQRRGCFGRTLATQRDWSRATGR
jgi:hypothetical protein